MLLLRSLDGSREEFIRRGITGGLLFRSTSFSVPFSLNIFVFDVTNVLDFSIILECFAEFLVMA